MAVWLPKRHSVRSALEGQTNLAAVSCSLERDPPRQWKMRALQRQLQLLPGGAKHFQLADLQFLASSQREWSQLRLLTLVAQNSGHSWEASFPIQQDGRVLQNA